MKKKVEKYLMGKNINGNSSMFDEKGRYLIGDDIEGTLSAFRVKKSGRGKGKKTSRDETAVEGGVTGEDGQAKKKAKFK